jgi:hypothetical protein
VDVVVEIAALAVSEQLENNEGEKKGWGSWLLRWGENLCNRQMLSQPESVGERAVGEDDTENSWQNSFTIIYVWVLLRSRVKGWKMTQTLAIVPRRF